MGGADGTSPLPEKGIPVEYSKSTNEFLTAEQAELVYDAIDEDRPVAGLATILEKYKGISTQPNQVGDPLLQISSLYTSSRVPEESPDDDIWSEIWEEMKQNPYLAACMGDPEEREPQLNVHSLYTDNPVYLAPVGFRQVDQTIIPDSEWHGLKAFEPPVTSMHTDMDISDRFDRIEPSVDSSPSFRDKLHIGAFFVGESGKVATRNTALKARYNISVHQDMYCQFDCPGCDTGLALFDTGGVLTFLNYHYYRNNPALHKLPKFTSRNQRVLLGNGEHLEVMFTVPIQIHIQGIILEVMAEVVKLNKYLSMLIGMGALRELEALLDTREPSVSIANRTIPVFLADNKEFGDEDNTKVILEAPFQIPINGEAICKLNLGDSYFPPQKLTFVNNRTILTIGKTVLPPEKRDTNRAVGFLDLRSIGYYHVNQGLLINTLPGVQFADSRHLAREIEKSHSYFSTDVITEPPGTELPSSMQDAFLEHDDRENPHITRQVLQGLESYYRDQWAAQEEGPEPVFDEGDYPPEFDTFEHDLAEAAVIGNTSSNQYFNDPAADQDVPIPMEQREINQDGSDYQWLKDSDWRKFTPDAKILQKQVNLTKSALSETEKEEFMQLLQENIEAFSLRDEIGTCPNLEVDIELTDKSDFFTRPFKCAEADKPKVDAWCERLVMLGVLTRNATRGTSPVMFISRKLTEDKRPVVDLRFLNSRVVSRNMLTPLFPDILIRLGQILIDIMSSIDFKDAYHSMRLAEWCKTYFGIIPYPGGKCYRFERLPMGLKVSPALWQQFILKFLDDVQHKDQFIAIMDDLLMYGKREEHLKMVVDLLKATIKHGLKLSPRKCHFFVTKLIYMGNLFTIEDQRVKVRPLADRTRAIRALPVPETKTDVKAFCGMMNFVSIYCPNLQGVLKPLYEISGEKATFLWGPAQQEAFDKAKELMVSPPVLGLPDPVGRLILYTDTSRVATGSALWQVQNGEPQILGYGSKSLPEACKNYSVTELEMKGLLTGCMQWKYILGRNEFDACVDHQACVYILKAKTEPATKRIMRLLEALSEFNFRLSYVKGKELIITDYLSRHPTDQGEDPYSVVPFCFHSRCDTDFDHREILREARDSVETLDKIFAVVPITEDTKSVGFPQTCNVTTRSQAKGLILDDPHKATKKLNPNVKPEYQYGQKYKRTKTKKVEIPPPAPIPEEVEVEREVETSFTIPESTPESVPSRREPSFTQVSKPQEQRQRPPDLIKRGEDTLEREIEVESKDQFAGMTREQRETAEKVHTDDWLIGLEQWPESLDMDYEESVPTRIEITRTRPSKAMFAIPPSIGHELKDLDKVDFKHLPRQVTIDKVIKQLRDKVLRDIHLCQPLKDLPSHYIRSPHFGAIYEFLTEGKSPRNVKQRNDLHASVSNYFVYGPLLFRLNPKSTDKEELEMQLCIPTSLVDVILYWFHTSRLGAHMGVQKVVRTLSRRFYCPELLRHATAYIRACHTCQIYKDSALQKRKLEMRVNIKTPAFRKLHMDVMHMGVTSYEGFKYILVVVCEVSSYMVAVPLKQERAPDIARALVDRVFAYFGMPTMLVVDQAQYNIGEIMRNVMKLTETRLFTISPRNHQALVAECAIKKLRTVLQKQLEGAGREWASLVPMAMLSCNAYCTPNMDGLSPFEVAMGQEARLIPEFETTSPELSATHREVFEKLRRKLEFLREKVQYVRAAKTAKENQKREEHLYQVGDLIYLFQPRGTILQTGTRKLQAHYVGPLVIDRKHAHNLYTIASIDGKLYPFVVHVSDLKPGYVKIPSGVATRLSEIVKLLSRSG